MRKCGRGLVSRLSNDYEKGTVCWVWVLFITIHKVKSTTICFKFFFCQGSLDCFFQVLKKEGAKGMYKGKSKEKVFFFCCLKNISFRNGSRVVPRSWRLSRDRRLRQNQDHFWHLNKPNPRIHAKKTFSMKFMIFCLLQKGVCFWK